VLSLVAGVLLAHLVPPAEFGRVAVAIVVSEVALALANQGIGSVLVQRRALDREHVESAALLALLVGAALTLLTFFLVPLATTPLFGEPTTELFQLFSPAFLIAAVGVVPLSMLERELNFSRISVIEITTVLVSAVTSVGLAIAGLGAEAYVLGSVTGLTVWAVLLLVFGPRVFPRWHRRQIREVAHFGLPAGLASMAMVGYGNVDYAVLGAMLSPAEVGFYYRAFTLGVQYETKISNIVARLALPVYSRTESLDHLRNVRSRVVRLNAAVVFPMLTLFIAVAPELVPWLFGERWEPAVLPAQILAVAGMARMINNGTPALVLAAGRPRALLAFNLYRLVALAAVVVVAVPYGLTAICVAVASFQVITLVGSYRFMLGRLVGVPLRQLLGDVRGALAASVILLAAALPLTRVLSEGSLSRPLTVVVVCAAGAPIYLLVLRLLAPETWNDMLLLARRVLPQRLQPKKLRLAFEGSASPAN
jgi:O-antigen/teichoic acid export membrane protein